MKFLVLAVFVAVATANHLKDNGPVELIVNGVPEGQPLELSDILDIKVKEHANGQLVSSNNILHPLTAEGIAEATAQNPIVPEPVVLPSPIAPEVSDVIPSPVVLPSPVAPEVVMPVPEPVVLPSPVAPEVVMPVPEPVVLPSPVAPEVIMPVPEPVVLPSPIAPEVIQPVVPEPVVLPSPVAPEVLAEELQVPNGEIFNDGTVSVIVNTPQEAGYLSTIQSWFSLVLNYFNDGAQTTQQIA